MNQTQLEALCDPTRLKILGLLAEKSLTNTELYDILRKQGVGYRESVFKALDKLKTANLVTRDYHEKIGYKYRLTFKEIKLSEKLVLKSQQ